MKPVIPITDRHFIYTPSYRTDLRTTFARINLQKMIALAKILKGKR